MGKGLEKFKELQFLLQELITNIKLDQALKLGELIGDVETELKKLETLENERNELIKSNIEKTLCLQLIKDKNVDTLWLLKSENCSKYNLGVGTEQRLKKTQYDMLKEILK